MDPLFTAPPRIEYVPDSGHWVPQEKAQLVNELLLDFLGDVSDATVKSFPMPDVPPA
jgi:hypothetical protein